MAEVSYLGEKAVSMDASGRSVYAKPGRTEGDRKKVWSGFSEFQSFPHYSVLRNVTDPLIHVQKKSKRRGLPHRLRAFKEDGTFR